MSTCGECGQDFCYRCMAVHERETGHQELKDPWTSEAWERADQYLKLQFGSKFGYYIESPWVTPRGMTLKLDLSGHPHHMGVVSFAMSADELATHPELSHPHSLGPWGLGDAIGKCLTEYLVKTCGLKASGKRPAW